MLVITLKYVQFSCLTANSQLFLGKRFANHSKRLITNDHRNVTCNFDFCMPMSYLGVAPCDNAHVVCLY